MASPCAFCRIIAGELPAAFVERGKHAVVVLDRNQVQRGHLLIVPNRHVASWDELDDDTASEIAILARRWARALRDTLGVTAYNLLVNVGAPAGQDVFHSRELVSRRTARRS